MKSLASASPQRIRSGLINIELTEKTKAQKNIIANSQRSKTKHLEKDF